ncbi:site-specific DNA-methyltransferase [Roseibium aggregatum]|uniref:site-specific DNA-methyltransferase n=1 Tax=Roseibium aggregatum TaxID=187304 RepID=UPI001E4511E3|nr:site-specific DNA-methyltransferase [Roseibium aggregatum]
MAETFLGGRVALHCGDSLDILKGLPADSLDACVTDAPYHLTSIVKRFGGNQAAVKSGKTGAYKRASAGFMGKQWDGGDIAFRPEIWREVIRVLKPGAYLLAFASTRGFGRMSSAIEEAGFVQHPLIAQLFDPDPVISAFLASLSEEQMGALARIVDLHDGGLLAWLFGSGFPKATRVQAEDYDGFRYGGQSLKPAIEPVFMGQKPFSEKNGTENILKHGTGAVNIDACRIGTEAPLNSGSCKLWSHYRSGEKSADRRYQKNGSTNFAAKPGPRGGSPDGRWPANVIHDGSAAVLEVFPEAPGAQGLVIGGEPTGAGFSGDVYAFKTGDRKPSLPRSDKGSAARFFYSAKADANDRIASKHPTVKPVDLMRYLVRLVTPPGGTVLDIFAGTGTTGEAAFYEGFNAVLCERETEYQDDIRRRMALCVTGPEERKREIVKARQADATADAGPLFSTLGAHS